MKLAFVDLYRPLVGVHKDPVSTPLGLQAEGHDVVLVSCDTSVTEPFQLGSLTALPAAHLANGGWRRAGFDAAVVISRFARSLTPLLREIKEAGIRLVVKGDTDGTIGYPLRPNYLRMMPVLASPTNILRHLKWRMPVQHWVGQKMAHVALADVVVVESPGAATNLVQVLRYWGNHVDARKVRFVPNQVAAGALAKPLRQQKQRRILAIGRWDDPVCKGTDILAQTIMSLLAERRDYRVTIIGSGVSDIGERLSKSNMDIVDLIGEMQFDDLQEIVMDCRIMLVPSRVESFSFVTAEALCAGASVAVTPIESLNYLSGGGNWGTVARDFSADALVAALLCEIERWEIGVHNPAETSRFWRDKLDSSSVSGLWLELLEARGGEAN